MALRAEKPDIAPYILTQGPSLWNAALRCQGQPLGLHDGLLSILLSPATASDAAGLRAQTGDGLSLHLKACNLSALAGAPPGDPVDLDSLSSLPDDLALALSRAALEQVARTLGLMAPLTFDGSPEHREVLRLGIRILRGSDALADVVTSGSPTAMNRLLMNIGPLPGQPPAEIASQVPVAADVLSGGLSLPVSTLEGLCAGDALLSGPVETLCCVRVGEHRIEVRKDETGWKMETIMSDTPPDAEDAASPGDIPVRIDFRIARGQMTLAQLGELVPGAVMPLSIDPPGPGDAVDILANGSKIGEGHVILIDDLPAVRIARLFGTGVHD